MELLFVGGESVQEQNVLILPIWAVSVVTTELFMMWGGGG